MRIREALERGLGLQEAHLEFRDAGWAVVAADSSSGIHLVWADLTPGNFEVYYRKFNK